MSSVTKIKRRPHYDPVHDEWTWVNTLVEVEQPGAETKLIDAARDLSEIAADLAADNEAVAERRLRELRPAKQKIAFGGGGKTS